MKLQKCGCCQSEVDTLTTDRDAAHEELRKAKVEAETLAKSIWRSEFKNESPEWRLCDTVAGVISQIDNMYAGVRTQRDAAIARAEKAEQSCATLGRWHTEISGQLQDCQVRAEKAECEVEDWKSCAKTAASENCPPDEKHCSCVPLLRKKVAVLQAISEARFVRAEIAEESLTGANETIAKLQAIVAQCQGHVIVEADISAYEFEAADCNGGVLHEGVFYHSVEEAKAALAAKGGGK